MDISVIVCTYNRSNYLRHLLECFREQTIPSDVKWEVIIVDNNSTDDTSDVVHEYLRLNDFIILYVRENIQGKSFALNTALRYVSGKIIAFTDDDVLLDKNWLKTVYDTFQEFDCDGLCGRILLEFPQKPPKWLKKELWGFLGYLYYGDKVLQIKNEPVFGGNMAFTREIIDKTGGFNTEIGRSGNELSGREDTEFAQRIIETGGKVMYQPSAIVWHIMDKKKFRKSYFKKLHYYEGMTAVKLSDLEVKRNFAGIPLFILSLLGRSFLKYIKNPTLRMQMNIWWFLGFMKRSMSLRQKK